MKRSNAQSLVYKAICKVKRKISKVIRGERQEFIPVGVADISIFDEKIATYRKRGSFIGKKVRLLGSIDGINPHLVSIGNYSVVGVQSALLAHCPIKGALPCKIGDYVYVGYGALVMPGVTVGNHSIVGAGAVVTKDVPEGSIVAGNPARIIRQLTDVEKDNIREVMLNDRLFGWD